MRRTLIALSIALCSATSAFAQLDINFSLPGVNIGINLPIYPTLQRVPGYPVYYAPGLNSNYFFYDGLYWVFDGDNWYASSWYNGPWHLVDRFDVPVYVLRVPVRYYRHAPAYFKSWRVSDAPRWGEHWGNSWEQRRSGWDQWNRSAAPAPAPLPTYQRQYSGNRYPQPTQQAAIQTQNYRYQPKDPVAQQNFQQQRQRAQAAPQPQATQPQATQPQRAERQRPQPQVAQPAQPIERQRPQAQPVQQPQPSERQRTQPQQDQQAQPIERQKPQAQPQQAARQQQQQAERQQQQQQQAARQAPQRTAVEQTQHSIEQAQQQAAAAREQAQPRAQPQERGNKGQENRGQDKGREDKGREEK